LRAGGLIKEANILNFQARSGIALSRFECWYEITRANRAEFVLTAIPWVPHGRQTGSQAVCWISADYYISCALVSAARRATAKLRFNPGLFLGKNIKSEI